MKVSPRSITLITASIVLLLSTAYMYVAYGSQAYFVAFHKPLHFGFNDTKTYVPPVLPKFHVTSSVTSSANTPTAPRTVTVTVTPTNKSAQAFVEVFITGEKNIAPAGPTYTKLGVNNDTGGEKVIYQNALGNSPTNFVKGKTQTFTYSYTPKAPLPNGTYRVSDIITSPNGQTDYYVNYNFAEFTL